MVEKVRNHFKKKYFNKCLFLSAKELEVKVNNFRNPKKVQIKNIKKLFVDTFLEYVDYYVLKSIADLNTINGFPSLDKAMENLKPFYETPLGIKLEIMENYFCEYQQIVANVVICKTDEIMCVSYKNNNEILNLHSFKLED